MILGPVSLIDCLVFVSFLAPQLLTGVGLLPTLELASRALPFLIFKLPYQLLKGRYFTPPEKKARFITESTFFEDLVVRCVRWGFKYIDSEVGKVFFSKRVALPFLRWRMLRHGYRDCPVHWREVEYEYGDGTNTFRGVWVKHKPEETPDFVLYYAHGGGFSMGSCYFYLEFLLVWHHLLVEAGFQNPAIFALDYTLVPDGVYPQQLEETLEGYKHVLEEVKDASKVCVAGDSAGGALVLSLLQDLGAKASVQKERGVKADVSAPFVAEGLADKLALPGLATLVSPWVTLITNSHYPSPVDYLDRQTLRQFALQYAGDSVTVNRHPASPGSCFDDGLWRAARPERGYYVIYGEEEVFGPDIEEFVKRQSQLGIETTSYKIPGGVHAWPVASLFLSSTAEKRLDGLRRLVREIRARSGVKEKM